MMICRETPIKTLCVALIGHDQSNHLIKSIAAALNWSGNSMIGGGGV